MCLFICRGCHSHEIWLILPKFLENPLMKDMFYLLKWKSDLNIEDIIRSLKDKNLLPTKLICPNCMNDMVIHKDSSRKDNYRWVCKKCRKRRPIRIHTWASKYRIPFTELYLLVCMYVEDVPVTTAAKRLYLEEEVVGNFYSDIDELRPVFLNKMWEIIERDVANSAIKSMFCRIRHDFRKLSRVFVLSSIFNIVLETLHEKL